MALTMMMEMCRAMGAHVNVYEGGVDVDDGLVCGYVAVARAKCTNHAFQLSLRHDNGCPCLADCCIVT